METEAKGSTWRLAAWKWICMIILVYVFLTGWLVPLHSGIIAVDPDKGMAGEDLVIEVTGYNSTYTRDPNAIRAWLRLQGDTVIRAKEVEVIDDRALTAVFHLPSMFPLRQDAYPMSLIIDNGEEGSSVLPNAVFVKPSPQPDSADLPLWFSDKIENIHPKAGFQFPFRNILSETIRNTYFHVPMWFCMIVLFGISAWHSLTYYRHSRMESDRKSMAYVRVGFLFGILGLVTGMIWAKHTWNAYWSWDVKQNMSAIALLIYAALLVMRSSVEDDVQKARLSAGYNMFAFVLLIPLLFIVPRMTDSLHPGSGGNPAMGGEDLDSTMRMVFYPAVIGFILLGIWISQLVYRIERLKQAR